MTEPNKYFIFLNTLKNPPADKTDEIFGYVYNGMIWDFRMQAEKLSEEEAKQAGEFLQSVLSFLSKNAEAKAEFVDFAKVHIPLLADRAGFIMAESLGMETTQYFYKTLEKWIPQKKAEKPKKDFGKFFKFFDTITKPPKTETDKVFGYLFNGIIYDQKHHAGALGENEAKRRGEVLAEALALFSQDQGAKADFAVYATHNTPWIAERAGFITAEPIGLEITGPLYNLLERAVNANRHRGGR